MNRILAGLRVIESSAFIAAPYAGMTLAQLGADVIRVDPPGGGLDYRRWPVTDAGASLYWAGPQQGQALRLRRYPQAGGPRPARGPDRRTRRNRRRFPDQPPCPGAGRLRLAARAARRPDHGVDRRQPRRHHGGRLHGERGGRLSACDRPRDARRPGEQRAAGVGPARRRQRGARDPRGGAPPPHDRRRPAPAAGAVGHGARDGRQSRLHRRGAGEPQRAPAPRQQHLRHVRPRLRNRRWRARHGRRLHRQAMGSARRRHRNRPTRSTPSKQP